MIFPDEVQLFLQFRDIATKEQAYQAKVIGNLYGYPELRDFVKKCIDESGLKFYQLLIMVVE